MSIDRLRLSFAVVLMALVPLAPGPVIAASDSAASDSTETRWLEIVLRFGQGGFRDSRAPDHKLGGDQFAIDLRPTRWPIAVSFTSEFYTKSPNATHSYEISGLAAVNLLYMNRIPRARRVRYFVGGGLGEIEVPQGPSRPDDHERSLLVNLEAGVNVDVVWRVGAYGVVKYISAHKRRHGQELIAFNEVAVLIGLTLNLRI